MQTARPTVSAIKNRATIHPRPVDSQKVNWGFQTTYFYEAPSANPHTDRIPAVTRSEQKILDAMLDLREVFGEELPEEESRVFRKRKRSYAVCNDLFEANHKGESAQSFGFDIEGMGIDSSHTAVSRTCRASPSIERLSFADDPDGYQMKLIGQGEVERKEPRVFLLNFATQLWAVTMEASKSLLLTPERLINEVSSLIRHLSDTLKQINKLWFFRGLSLKKVEQRPARIEAVSLDLHRLAPLSKEPISKPSDLEIQTEGTGSAKTGIFSLTTLPSSPSNSPPSTSDKESPESPLRIHPASERKKNRHRKCLSQGQKLRNINFLPSRNRRGKEIPLSMSEEFGDQIRRSPYRALLVFA